MKFIWRTWTESPSEDSLGHGILIYDRERDRSNQIIAFVEGYEWYHGLSETVLIHVMEPDTITTSEIIDELKQTLEGYLKPKYLPHGMLTSRIGVWING